jgi:hypothetical protein
MSGRAKLDMTPRLLTHAEAAAYCRLSPVGFNNWIAAGRLPPAIPGTHRWDRTAIDIALDKISGIQPTTEPSAYDQWKAKRHANAS